MGKNYNKRKSKYKTYPLNDEVLDQPSYFSDFPEKERHKISLFDHCHPKTEIARAHCQIYDLERPEKQADELER